MHRRLSRSGAVHMHAYGCKATHQLLQAYWREAATRACRAAGDQRECRVMRYRPG